MLGSFDIGAGLLAVSGFIGWAVGVAVVVGRRARRRHAPAAGPGGRRASPPGRSSLGFVLLWAWSRVEGGVMDPIAYLDERFGPIACLNIVVAGRRRLAARPLTGDASTAAARAEVLCRWDPRTGAGRSRHRRQLRWILVTRVIIGGVAVVGSCSAIG